jgi:2-oxoglutarate ferredoxin oxidoreductase subunit gamma
MRGGTANVSTVVSDEAIASPIVSFPDSLVALHHPSIDKCAASIRAVGILISNSDMCPHGCKREDISIIKAPMVEIARKLESDGLEYAGNRNHYRQNGYHPYETMEDDLTSFMKSKNPELLELNLKAIKRGIEIGKQ